MRGLTDEEFAMLRDEIANAGREEYCELDEVRPMLASLIDRGLVAVSDRYIDADGEDTIDVDVTDRGHLAYRCELAVRAGAFR